MNNNSCPKASFRESNFNVQINKSETMQIGIDRINQGQTIALRRELAAIHGPCEARPTPVSYFRS
ncbi:MAG: hypothetical protein WDA26_13290 [Pusillimonas sp.]